MVVERNPMVSTQEAVGRGIRDHRRSPLIDVKEVASGLQFPEGPVVLPDGDLAVVELHGSRITRISSGGRLSTIAETTGMPNGAAVGPDGALYIANNGGRDEAGRWNPGRVDRVDVETGAIEPLYEAADDGGLLEGPNDLVFDRHGGFWLTDYRAGEILYGQADGSRLERVVVGEGARYCNGIGLGPHEQWLCWAETKTRQVRRLSVTAPGRVEPSNGVTVSTLKDGPSHWDSLVVGLPGAQEVDSLAVQADGAICVGTLVDAGITVVHPDGGPAVLWTLPAEFEDRAPTNLCFGGEDLMTAFIVLSDTGRVVSCRWPSTGLALAH
jgi:gluconolactonase